MPVARAVARLDAMSAHADRGEILRWLADAAAPPPAATCLVHGEPAPMDALQDAGLVQRTTGLARGHHADEHET